MRRLVRDCLSSLHLRFSPFIPVFTWSLRRQGNHLILIEVTQLRRLRPVQRHARHRRGRPDRRAALDDPLNRAVRWRPGAAQAEEVNPPARGCFAS